MSQFLTVQCKKGYEIKLTDVIAKYVRETYGDEQCNSHGSAFSEFNNMRSKMLSKLFDRHESTLNILTKYHDQFVALEGKIPLEENGVRIDFKWDDAFTKDSLFGKKNHLKIASGGFERISILFNIAALYSQVAESQNFSDDVGLKGAAKYFQQAAGIFSYLRSAVPMIVQGEPTIDLNSDTLSALNALMLAQAQELIFTKAARDQMKEGNVAKIAQQASDLYVDAMKLMQLNSVKSIWPKDWIPIVAGKQAGFHALAEYYQAKACGANQSFGEQIARLKKATELMKASSTRSGPKFMFRTEQERIRRDLEIVEKENNLIYHDSVPDGATLSVVSKAVLAKEISIENPMNKDFRDLFEKIVPLAIHSAVIMFDNKKKSLINGEVFRLKEATANLNGIMASLNLPAAIEDSSSDDVPDALITKATAVRSAGGLNKIESMLNALPDLYQRNFEILQEAINMLDEEEESDKKLKEQFKERWSRTPSNKLTEGWRGESTKFSGILTQARQSDETVRKGYMEHIENFRILSQNESAVKAAIPKAAADEVAISGGQSIREDLKRLCSEVDSLKRARDSLIEEVHSLELNNISSVFIKALTEDSALNQEQFADENLNKLILPFRERVRESLGEQDRIVSKVQEKSMLLGGGASQSGASRASVISSLTLSADKFHDLIGNLEEGQKFYGDITELLLKFQNKVKDFCFARKTEKDELMKDLQSSIVRERTDVTTATSNFQATSTGTDSNRQNTTSQAPTPNRPPPTYQGVASSNAPMAAANAPPPATMPPANNPYHMPYPPSVPTFMPQPPLSYQPGVPPPQQPGMPQPYPMSYPQQYQPGYGTYPGYNQMYNPYNPNYNAYNPNYPR